MLLVLRAVEPALVKSIASIPHLQSDGYFVASKSTNLSNQRNLADAIARMHDPLNFIFATYSTSINGGSHQLVPHHPSAHRAATNARRQ
jgi:hypothetical protein